MRTESSLRTNITLNAVCGTLRDQHSRTGGSRSSTSSPLGTGSVDNDLSVAATFRAVVLPGRNKRRAERK